MNRDELLAAAEGAMNLISTPNIVCNTERWYKIEPLAGTLARHIQRLYDPTPCTGEWIASVGGSQSADGTWRIGGVQFWLSPSGPMLVWNSLDWICQPTRGDIRRLCDALRIELREDA